MFIFQCSALLNGCSNVPGWVCSFGVYNRKITGDLPVASDHWSQ